MPFTENQKAKFIALLQTKGWELREGIIWSPRRGLHLSDAHFSDWSPAHVHEMFTRRAERFAKMDYGDWQSVSRENQEAAWAAEAVIDV